MGHTQEKRRELRDLAHAIYTQRLKQAVETPENIGKIISIDTLSGDYEINDDYLTAIKRLRERLPSAETFTLRIGYNAVYAIGNAIARTTP